MFNEFPLPINDPSFQRRHIVYVGQIFSGFSITQVLFCFILVVFRNCLRFELRLTVNFRFNYFLRNMLFVIKTNVKFAYFYNRNCEEKKTPKKLYNPILQYDKIYGLHRYLRCKTTYWNWRGNWTYFLEYFVQIYNVFWKC